MTVADYMEKVLYGPEGYYGAGVARTGREGDYFTAPDVGPVFGRLLAHIFAGWWNRFEKRPIDWVEVGAGEGRLARVMLECLESNFAEQAPPWNYVAVEKSPARRKILKQSAQALRKPFDVLPDLTALSDSSIHGCLFANELIDAFPVHRVRQFEGRFEEAFVQEENNQPHLVWREPSSSQLAQYLQRISITLPDDYETEINLAMGNWIQQAARVLDQGVIVLVDYGRPAHDYYAPERHRGTLRGFSQHLVRDPLDLTPGATAAPMDWTSDVDFTSLALDAQEAGLEVLAYMDMSSFLMQGAADYVRHPLNASQNHTGLRYLVHPDGMGSQFQVLILGKKADRAVWRFQGNRILRLGLGRTLHAERWG
jgi:SAM-dependent MidA family methyltransferase